MTIFHSVFRRFASAPGKEKILDISQDVADLWPSTTKHEPSPFASSREAVDFVGASDSEDLPAAMTKEWLSPEPVNMPDIKHDSDTLMYDFIHKCVEVAVGEQIKESALKHAKEKLDAAVAFHELLQQEHLRFAHAIAGISSMRPFYVSAKDLAQTRIGSPPEHRLGDKEEVRAPGEGSVGDDIIEEKMGQFELMEVVPSWNEKSWSIPSFNLLLSERDCSDTEPDDETMRSDSSTDVDVDDEEQSFLGSIILLRDYLQKDLNAISSLYDGYHDAKSGSPPQVMDIYALLSWPSDTFAEKNRQQIKRLCECRRSSISPEERASIKERIQEENFPASHLWERIRQAQADHDLAFEEEPAPVAFCSQMIQAITEIEIEWDVYKQTTATERHRAQILALRLQWDVNGSQRLETEMDTEIFSKKQEQMDLWQDIVCAAELRESPVVEETNIYGSIHAESEEGDPDDQAGLLLLRAPKFATGVLPDESHEDLSPVEHLDTELFGPMDTDLTGAAESKRNGTGPVEAESDPPAEELRTMRLDSCGPAWESWESAHGGRKVGGL